MTSGNGAERSGEEPAAGPVDGSLRGSTDGSLRGSTDDSVDGSFKGSTDDSVDGEETTVDPAPTASADQPRTCRRKAGVEYRPV